jgi:esterase
MKLHYKKLGVGQPLVILHGLFGSSDNWQTLANKFAENFEVYLVDQRNHGHSPHSDEFSYQLMADDLFELIQIEMLSDILLVGHSMGGKTAMWFAQQHPSYIDKLVVVDMGIRAYPSHHERILAGMNAIDLKTTKSRGVADRVLAEYVPELATKMFLMKNLYWVERGQLGWRINLPVLEEKINEILGEVPDEVVDIPTLFIRGEKSNYILEEDYFELRQSFPHSTVHTVKDAGHWVHAEAPEEFYDVLIDFAE